MHCESSKRFFSNFNERAEHRRVKSSRGCHRISLTICQLACLSKSLPVAYETQVCKADETGPREPIPKRFHLTFPSRRCGSSNVPRFEESQRVKTKSATMVESHTRFDLHGFDNVQRKTRASKKKKSRRITPSGGVTVATVTSRDNFFKFVFVRPM